MDLVPDLGDPLFPIWRIGWVYRQLLGDPRPLFDANIFQDASSGSGETVVLYHIVR